jgi:hypothetical protein
MRSKLFGLASLCFAAVGCSDPVPFDANPKPKPDEEEEACPVSPEWLPRTPGVDQYKPPPHPASECAFYRASWQNFMIVTQPEDDGTIALQSYATVDDLFERKVPRAERHAWLGDIKQAGGRQILIDQAGRPIYYGIHVNKVFEAGPTACATLRASCFGQRTWWS